MNLRIPLLELEIEHNFALKIFGIFYKEKYVKSIKRKLPTFTRLYVNVYTLITMW